MIRFSPREQRWMVLGVLVLGVVVWFTWPRGSKVATTPGDLVTNVGNATIQQDQFDKPAPDLQLTGLDASSFSVAAHSNDPALVLVFWRTDCSACLEQLNTLSSLSETLGTHLYAINVGESAEVVTAFLKDHPQTAHILLDPGNTAAMHYATTPLPTSSYIHLGNVVGFGVGTITAEQLRIKISSLQVLD